MPPPWRGGGRSVELPPDDERGDDGGRLPGWGRMVGLSRPEWPMLGLGLVCLVVGLAPMLILPVAFGRVVDAIVDERTARHAKLAMLDRTIAVLAGLFGVGALASGIRAYVFVVCRFRRGAATVTRGGWEQRHARRLTAWHALSISPQVHLQRGRRARRRAAPR